MLRSPLPVIDSVAAIKIEIPPDIDGNIRGDRLSVLFVLLIQILQLLLFVD